METLKFGSDYQNCAHSFAYADKDGRGENYGRRMFYYNDTIYSYGHHFIIAKKVRNKTGGVAFVLFNEGSASQTTNKQQWAVKRALPHTILEVGTDIDNFNPLKEIAHKESLLITDADLFSRARAEHKKDEYLSNISANIKDIAFLMGYYKVKSKVPKRTKEIVNNLENTEALLQLLGVAQAKINKANKAKETRAEKARAKKAKEVLKKETETLEKWKNNEVKRIYLYQIRTDHLRISEDKTLVETSQGSSTTIEEAKKVLRLIEQKKAIGYKIDDSFTIKAINGVFAVGCHNIPMEEIKRLKPQILAL